MCWLVSTAMPDMPAVLGRSPATQLGFFVSLRNVAWWAGVGVLIKLRHHKIGFARPNHAAGGFCWGIWRVVSSCMVVLHLNGCRSCSWAAPPGAWTEQLAGPIKLGAAYSLPSQFIRVDTPR